MPRGGLGPGHFSSGPESGSAAGPCGGPENVAHLFVRPGFSLVRCDVTEFLHVTGPVDLVLRFASPASPVDYLKLPLETLRVGSVGTWHALGLAKAKGARLHTVTMDDVLGVDFLHRTGPRTAVPVHHSDCGVFRSPLPALRLPRPGPRQGARRQGPRARAGGDRRALTRAPLARW
ncbi:MAG TPA: hypothetical protein VES95_13710 [Dermatophilaceae bacterium]|nr:hypothetical protein [Dermatophilaceae bacterium]